MIKKYNAHDSGYKKLFSNHEMVRQLLTSFVDEDWVNNIKFSTMERIDKSFVSDEFMERESDLIYKAEVEGRELYIFILLEFQSTVDRFMSLRMLRYITELYEDLVKNYRLKRLPAVFPVMLYNGEKRWTAPEQLSNLIEKTIPEGYIPEFRYCKIAENEYSKDFLKNIKNAVAALFYTENCSGEALQHEINSIADLLKSEKPREIALFINWFKYIFQDRKNLIEEFQGIEGVKTMLRTSVKKITKQAEKEGLEKGLQKGLQKGIEKGLQKGIREGIQKGIQEGEKRKAVETAIALLKRGMAVKEISDITRLSIKQIEKIKGE